MIKRLLIKKKRFMCFIQNVQTFAQCCFVCAAAVLVLPLLFPLNDSCKLLPPAGAVVPLYEGDSLSLVLSQQLSVSQPDYQDNQKTKYKCLRTIKIYFIAGQNNVPAEHKARGNHCNVV